MRLLLAALLMLPLAVHAADDTLLAPAGDALSTPEGDDPFAASVRLGSALDAADPSATAPAPAGAPGL